MTSSAYPSHTTLEDPYAVADAEYGIPEDQVSKGVKRGHKFCFCCCDSRKAVIFVNCITLILNVMVLTNLIYDRIKSRHVQVDDDHIKREIRHSGILFTMGIITFVGSACGIFGAKIYNIWLVAIAAMIHLVYVVRDTIELNFVMTFIMLVLVYPHLVFIREVQKGIMCHENYPSEKQWF